MNGGVARVLLSTLKYAPQYTPGIYHEIIILEPADLDTQKSIGKFENQIFFNKSDAFIADKLEQADIVQIEWWNHPIINKFLFLFDIPSARILVCSHISGLFRPQIITANIVEYSDIFLAVTRATEKHSLFNNSANVSLKEKVRFIRFPVDVDRLHVEKTVNTHTFNVGYVGTVNYSKIHKNYLQMCADVKVPNARFIICGQDENGSMQLESQKFGSAVFEFMGHVTDINRVLPQIDVFAYPLASNHFGSGEQAILEAMYFGIAVVAFNNAAESEIIEDGVTGVLVNTEKEYVESIEYLYEHPEERFRLGRNAKAFVESHLDPRKCFHELEQLYRLLLLTPKHIRTMGNRDQIERLNLYDIGANLLIESLGDKGKEFRDSFLDSTRVAGSEADVEISRVELAMKVKAKGSVNQYLRFFPNDRYLNFWMGLIKQNENRHEEAVVLFEEALSIGDGVPRAREYLERSLTQLFL